MFTNLIFDIYVKIGFGIQSLTMVDMTLDQTKSEVGEKCFKLLKKCFKLLKNYFVLMW